MFHSEYFFNALIVYSELNKIEIIPSHNNMEHLFDIILYSCISCVAQCVGNIGA